VSYFPDSAGRVVKTQASTGPTLLITSQSWDSQNNLIETVDARGNATDYAHDLNGNQTAVAEPAPSQGAFRPTTLTSYDSFNNVIATCSPNATHILGLDWTTGPGSSATPCPGGVGTARIGYNYSNSSEPFGQVTDVYSPCYGNSSCTSPGTHVHLTYDSFGEVTLTQGDSFTQNIGSIVAPIMIAPSTATVYDQYGNTLQSNSLGQTGTPGTSFYGYDKLNRPVSTIDPDGAATCTHYNSDGSVQSTETSTERAAAALGPCSTTAAPATVAAPGQYATTYAYDVDGNEVNETSHFGNTAGTTTKWYDGADRLVEVSKPGSSYPFTDAWCVRYLYDLSQNGKNSIVSASGNKETFASHGNLFSTQTYVPPDQIPFTNNPSGAQLPPGPTGWQTTAGYAYDVVSRITTAYKIQPSWYATQVWQTFQSSYDSSASTYGLLASVTDPLNQTTNYTYDAIGNLLSKQFANSVVSTPAKFFVYDASGNITGIAGAYVVGQPHRNPPFAYQYDADGRLVSKTDALSTTLSYTYYPNGKKASLSVAGPEFKPAFNQNNLFQYAYRADGLPIDEVVNYAVGDTPGTGKVQPSQLFSWSYTPAGRFTGLSDPLFPAGAVSETYDSYNRPAQYHIPAGTYTIAGIDAEGDTTQMTGAYQPPVTENIAYDARGELASVSTNPSSSTGEEYADASGYLDPLTSNGSVVTEAYFDPINAVKLWQRNATDTGLNTWVFDAAGREQSLTSMNVQGTSVLYQGTSKYDVENHLVSYQVSPAVPATIQYAWGLDGHLATLSGDPSRKGQSGYSPGDESLTWDGDQLLFTANSNLQVDDIKIGTLADITIPSSGFKRHVR
jgi:YD repeat-containing protein